MLCRRLSPWARGGLRCEEMQATYQPLAVLAGRQFPQFLIVGTNGDDTRAESPALA